MLHPIGIRVRVNGRAGSEFEGRTGTIVHGTYWYNSKSDCGDRGVLMDDTGERLVFEGWMLDSIQREPSYYRRIVRMHLDMAHHYRSINQRAAAARSLTHAQASLRSAMQLPVVEWIATARRYDGSVNAFATRYLP